MYKHINNFKFKKMENKKMSLSDLKAKAGKAFVEMESVKGGLLAACHIPPIKVGPFTQSTDNV